MIDYSEIAHMTTKSNLFEEALSHKYKHTHNRPADFGFTYTNYNEPFKIH